ncbi:helix-turn-helix domain-containing protein [Sphingopyxis sp. USTB-05]|uniref:helix-turn-helix domain-containing protein n=1 Tax=Sphingopyxis sp. USTB-05 TaxID=2830667 RepID=UPI002078D7AC|nr:helix-turn-helix transcriptional regulator [Sphingopyxis sp. USTB-05]USI77706.1 helix-turn-helix domain-containing protein [Sphingopyxis sp. USTB-05]
MSLAMRLQNLRTAKQQSLQEVADAIGASKAHIWELEKGTAKNPSIELVRKLADYFEVSISRLVGESPDEDGDDERLLVIYRQLKSLDLRDRLVLGDIIKGMQKRRSGA